MNEEHFLTELKIHLKPLEKNQLEYVLQTYEEKFEQGKAAGETEEFISQKLGKPKDIAARILEEFHIPVSSRTQNSNEWTEFTGSHTYHDYEQDYYEDIPYHHDPYDHPRRQPSWISRFFKIFGLFCLNFFLVFWLLFALIMLVGSLWLAAVLLVGSPILGGIALFSLGGTPGTFQLFVSLIFCGLGLLFVVPLSSGTRFAARLCRTYLLWNWRIVKGVCN